MRRYIFYMSCIFLLGASIFLGILAYELLENRNCSKSEECRQEVVSNFFAKIISERLPPEQFLLRRDKKQCISVGHDEASGRYAFVCTVGTACSADLEKVIYYETKGSLLNVGNSYWAADSPERLLALYCPESIINFEIQKQLVDSWRQGG